MLSKEMDDACGIVESGLQVCSWHLKRSQHWRLLSLMKALRRRPAGPQLGCRSRQLSA